MEQPKVLVPFSVATDFEENQDIFVYLRPETNGVLTESTLFSVLRGSKVYASHTKMVYLANIPGEFLVSQRIIEEHYRLKVEFAHKGKELFTPSMIQRFEARFGEDFKNTEVLGAFQFIAKTGITEGELFHLWVDGNDFMVLNGQTIKRWKNIYIVNYDIPAILHKNNQQTDIAVFLLRSSLSAEEVRNMISDMEASLRSIGILKEGMPSSRAFHYSKGPFEQLLDARGFLYQVDGSHIPLKDVSFYRFLASNGLQDSNILRILDNPIMLFQLPNGEENESDVFSFTAGMSYEEAYTAMARSHY
jgi:hypothetical protein